MSLSPVADALPPTEQSQSRRSILPAMKRWSREPLLHFLLLGVVLFGAYAYFQRGRGGVESSKQIALSLDDLRTMEMYFESQWHRQPTPAEFQAMVEDKVREEVLYREALAMNLDKDDTIVKRRMAQKMQFLSEDVAAAHEPSTAELKAWFDKNKEQVRPAQPLQLPPSLLFARQARQERARRRCQGSHEDCRPAGRLQTRGISRRPIHVPGLLRRPRSRRLGQGVRPAIRGRPREAQARFVAGADRIRIRLAPGLH